MHSRERLLAALRRAPVDYTPCSFMIFTNLQRDCATHEEFVLKQLALGLDACVHTGYLRPSYHPAVRETVWTEQQAGQTIFRRRLETPKGSLTQRVRQHGGWPAPGDFHPYNDWIIPRSDEFLIKPEEDLEKLPYVLGPFRDEEIAKLRATAETARRLANRHGILQVGGWSSMLADVASDDGVMGADAMSWLSGYVDVMELSLTQPEIIGEYMRIIHEWNLRHISLYLDETDAELILRRAWYETTEFWTPAAYRRIILPCLRREAELVHQAGRLFGLIVTSAFLPLLDDILASGIDVLVGLDPAEGKGTDLAEVKRRFRAAGRAVWGGVSGAITVEQGTAADTEAAVIDALRVLGEGGGFILSPVDNVRENTPRAWENTRVFIDAWKRHR